MIRRKDVKCYNHVCADCSNATWVTRKEYPAHFDLNDKPITMICSVLNKLVVRSQRACSNFKNVAK